MRSLIGNIIFLAALLLIMARFLTVWAGTPFPIDLISSNSMSPSLMEGDIIAWTPTTMDDIKRGDVVVFKSYVNWPGEKLVVHRVANIVKDSHGNPLLETKGDANEWTDQDAPQVLEQYIREDHVIGKVVSVGQQPLKIPFIGYLGIWVSHGLDLLAQPTAEKGSLVYVGVFAPLTASAVILVILIFVIPEKAKSIKEKIRFYIFGHRPSSIKKTLVFFLVAYVVFLTVIHCFAFDSMSASVGINGDSPESGMNFGRIVPGTTSFSKDLPVFNPSITPVKGIVFGRGQINNIVTREIFELKPGATKAVYLRAEAPNGTQNGSYAGDIMVYSSPFWLLFPNEFIKNLCNWNAEATVYCLDLLTALFLTSITMFLLISITFTGEKYTIWTTDRSWHHSSKLILKKETIARTSVVSKKIRQLLGRNVGWITKTDLAEIGTKKTLLSSLVKPVLASSVVIPILFLITDQIAAMIISTLIAGLAGYFISCKTRKKIILTIILTMSMVITYMMIYTNILLITKQHTTLELMALGLGAVGVYLLILGFFLIPLILLSWYLVRILRNLKERKDPLLMLEGSCDL
jgi:signal peptidase